MPGSVMSAALLAVSALLVAPPAHAASGAVVDLNLSYDVPTIDRGGHGTLDVTVANTGADAGAPAVLTVTTPVSVSADPSQDLPHGCFTMFAGTEPTVPQVIRCAVPALAHGKSAAFALPLAVAAAAATGITFGEAVVEPGQPDVQQHTADSIGWPSIVVRGADGATRPPGPGRVTDLYLSADLPAIAAGRPASQTFTVGNLGPDTTAGPAELVVATPPYVPVNEAAGLPAGCGFLYHDSDPAAPEIVRCALPAGLTAGAKQTVALPLVAMWGAPVETIWGISAVFPGTPADIDPVSANNVLESGVQVVG